ncbi:MAG: 50S ribosomal protein L18e [Candidatus Altiarchaeota archaeon]
MPKTNKFKNPERERLIEKLKREGREKKVNLWIRIADELSKSRKNRRETNIWKINKYSKDGEFVLIPGKVLGYGNLEHKVNVAAFKFSKSAEEKIKSAGGEVISIEELLRRNPTGSKVKILC